jgi:probable biosynthetic protein (TIGR04099 family)
MPHLAFGGLSENWLIKECGHAHWCMLAEAWGLSVTAFTDSDGNKLYAAFTVLNSSSRLEFVQENDGVEIHSDIRRVSHTQFYSTHTLRKEGLVCATVELVSTFILRTRSNSNIWVRRAALAPGSGAELPIQYGPLDLVETGRRLRSEQLEWEIWGIRPSTVCATGNTFHFTPCPHNDFNGVDFLYFASFQSIADRAEWQWRPKPMSPSRALMRRIFYYSNLDLGDAITVRELALTFRESDQLNWCRLFRDSDGARIADVFAVRRAGGNST